MCAERGGRQQLIWKVAEKIGDQEGRFDFCVAAAGINRQEYDCLEYPEKVWNEARTTILVVSPALGLMTGHRS